MKMLQTLATAALATVLLLGMPTARADDDVIRFGITAPMSGAAASWGIGADWGASRR
jgi:branched-chain amino acid transport system substrate-binding protein